LIIFRNNFEIIVKKIRTKFLIIERILSSHEAAFKDIEGN